MLALFEVRVREAEEYLGELGFGEEVWEKLHRVGAYARYILVGSEGGVLSAEGADFFLYIFSDRGADFHSFDNVRRLWEDGVDEGRPRIKVLGNLGANAKSNPP